MLQTTLNYSRISDGAFDPTMKPLIKMWGFNGATAPENLPSAQTISDTLKKTGYTKLELSQSDAVPPTYTLHPHGMSLDLGGIAKGFAVDQAYNEIMQNPKTANLNLLINLGGNIRCHGQATPDRPWCIGVRNPFDSGRIVGSITMTNGSAVATSGNYERFVIINGKRYAHIIDPRTGDPVQGMAEVTILSNNATETDAISTSLYIAGVKGAPDILAKLPNCRAIIIPDKHPIEIWISPDMKKFFTPLPQYSKNVHLITK
jgi:thiamine biosynthesis lipoprotein